MPFIFSYSSSYFIFIFHHLISIFYGLISTSSSIYFNFICALLILYWLNLLQYNFWAIHLQLLLCINFICALFKFNVTFELFIFNFNNMYQLHNRILQFQYIHMGLFTLQYNFWASTHCTSIILH